MFFLFVTLFSVLAQEFILAEEVANKRVTADNQGPTSHLTKRQENVVSIPPYQETERIILAALSFEPIVRQHELDPILLPVTLYVRAFYLSIGPLPWLALPVAGSTLTNHPLPERS